MILDEIVKKTKERVTRNKENISIEDMKALAYQKPITYNYPFLQALKQDSLSYIMEIKKASPSKAVIAEEFHYIEIAKEYERIGASAISVLTEPDFFQGHIQFLKDIRKHVKIPILRKDFIIDEYMIYEAKAAGADAILLICSLLDDEQLKSFLDLTHDLGMSALVEAHNALEVQRALAVNAAIIGVNNRDLRDFSVDFYNSIELRKSVPDDVIFVSESGINSHEHIQILTKHHINAVLIGETLMRSSNKQETFDHLRGKTNED